MAKKPNYPTWKAVPTKNAKAPSPPVDFAQAKDARRVKDVEGARTIYTRLVSDNSLRFATCYQVRNQLEGGRPKDQAQMEASGSGWETNVNFGDAAADLNRTIIPYWKMVNDVPRKSAVTIPSNAPQADRWRVAFEECYDEFLEDWDDDYKQQFMRMCRNFVAFGPGPMQFCDEDSPRYKSVNPTRMLFPKNCEMSMSQWEVVALTRDMSATELYGYIKDKKTTESSEYAGWNAKAIKTTIVQAKDGGSNPDYRDYTKINDMLVNNDIAITTPFQPINCVWLYVKQFGENGKPGKIGCYVFTQTAGVEEFLYSDDDCAESFQQLFSVCWYDTGTEGMVHSIKGFGIKNYHPSTLLNRVKSRAVDAGTVGMGLNFQYANDNQPDETPPIESFGFATIFPTGLVQIPVYANPQVADRLLAMLENNRNENNSLYRQQNAEIADSDTATQANLLASMQGELSVASASLFLAQFGQCISEQYRRLRKKGNKNEDAKKFVKRMKERGVPDDVIHDKEIRVKTGANAGLANPAMRLRAFQESLALAQLPGVNRRWILEGIFAERFGSQGVSKGLLPEGQESEPVQRRQAQMENTVFGQGVELEVAPTDAHFEHVQEHLKPAGGIVAGFKQTGQITPEQASALVIVVEHMGKHMAFLQQDETQKPNFQQVLPAFRLIQGAASGILQQMQKGQVNGQPPQSGVAPVVPMQAQ